MFNKVAASLIFHGAQTAISEKTDESARICNGIYDNHPFQVADLITTGQPVKFSRRVNGESMFFNAVFFEDGRITITRDK